MSIARVNRDSAAHHFSLYHGKEFSDDEASSSAASHTRVQHAAAEVS